MSYNSRGVILFYSPAVQLFSISMDLRPIHWSCQIHLEAFFHFPFVRVQFVLFQAQVQNCNSNYCCRTPQPSLCYVITEGCTQSHLLILIADYQRKDFSYRNTPARVKRYKYYSQNKSVTWHFFKQGTVCPFLKAEKAFRGDRIALGVSKRSVC